METKKRNKNMGKALGKVQILKVIVTICHLELYIIKDLLKSRDSSPVQEQISQKYSVYT